MMSSQHGVGLGGRLHGYVTPKPVVPEGSLLAADVVDGHRPDVTERESPGLRELPSREAAPSR